MSYIEKVSVINGVSWVSIPEAELNLLCGCPADVVKHLFRLGLIKNIEKNGVHFESGPNAILLSDVPVQNGQFCNLAEFPVLQMLYRQGMIIPKHPNNKGNKPMLVGTPHQVKAQLEYIYRGNYGLTTLEEMKEAGVDDEWAKDILRMKLKFAFGKIKTSDEFIDTVTVGSEEVEIKNGVKIKKVGRNLFKVSYKGEEVDIDLNLKPGQIYQPPYNLGFFQIKREHFAIVHSGEGDGWDMNRPCMGSIVIYNGYIYLIDCPPNLLSTLNALGIGVSEIRGVFHTHCHDDHFNGITTLLQADHRIKYYATSLVRTSVSKKLSALMSTKVDILGKYFDVQDLLFDKWNEVEGLQVMPTFSPHPVETNNYTFRVISEGGFRTYAHLADISSFDVLRDMLADKPEDPGISREFYAKVREQYLTPVDIKKIDNGGGMIHGKASDFENDDSNKIILSHSSLDLTNEEKEIGIRASFGLEDILIPSNADQVSRYAKRFLHAYYPTVDFVELRDLLNCPVVVFNAGDMLMKKGELNKFVLLTLTGTVEMVQAELNRAQMLPAGSLIGDVSSMLKEPLLETYVAVGYVWALKIPENMLWDFAERQHIFENIILTQKKVDFLRSLLVFSDIAYSPVINGIAQKMKKIVLNKDQELGEITEPTLYILSEGQVELSKEGSVVGNLGVGEIIFEDSILFRSSETRFSAKALEDCILYKIPGDVVRDIPAARWKMYEIYEKRNEK